LVLRARQRRDTNFMTLRTFEDSAVATPLPTVIDEAAQRGV